MSTPQVDIQKLKPLPMVPNRYRLICGPVRASIHDHNSCDDWFFSFTRGFCPTATTHLEVKAVIDAMQQICFPQYVPTYEI